MRGTTSQLITRKEGGASTKEAEVLGHGAEEEREDDMIS